MKIFYGEVVWNILHAPLVRGTTSYVPDIEPLYLAAGPRQVVGVAFHPNDWLDNSAAILECFDFLASQDPAGARSVTARELLGAMVIPGDFDIDQDVDLADLALLLQSFGYCAPEAGCSEQVDMDGDGCVDLSDLSLFMANYGLRLAGT